uniref:Uncharacterized protein n=1 Tax=Amphora coffeiformis TaxID=265554 RepID=A0A7S3LF65_9STRA|mmetsp:Transcript_8236/g.15682  ORF Transcript_8236/g.15682 Transcript_8236/m.15682 type:complete len:233 (-) Transcript_8236:25-723(-)
MKLTYAAVTALFISTVQSSKNLREQKNRKAQEDFDPCAFGPCCDGVPVAQAVGPFGDGPCPFDVAIEMLDFPGKEWDDEKFFQVQEKLSKGTKAIAFAGKRLGIGGGLKFTTVTNFNVAEGTCDFGESYTFDKPGTFQITEATYSDETETVGTESIFQSGNSLVVIDQDTSFDETGLFNTDTNTFYVFRGFVKSTSVFDFSSENPDDFSLETTYTSAKGKIVADVCGTIAPS